MIQPIYYPNQRQRMIDAIKNIAGWACTIAVFAGIGVLLALGV
jgi:hypothetical protein